MNTIQIQAYCSQCKKTSWVEVSPEELNGHIERETKKVFLPPVPGGREEGTSGLLKRSLSHGDHVLLIEIDRNGTVRRESVVNLISSVIENIVAQAVERTITVDESLKNCKKKIMFISKAYAFHEFFKSVLSILMLNLDQGEETRSFITKDRVELVYNNLTLIQVPYEESLHHFKDKSLQSIVVDVDTYSNDTIFTEIPTSRLSNINIILAYNSKKGQERPIELFKDLLSRGISKLSLFDYSSGKGLSNIIDASYRNVLEQK